MYKKLASNTLAQIFSKVATAFIALFLIALLTRTLPVEYFWAYNKIYNYFAIIAFLADLGLYTLIIREISQWKSAEKVLWNSLSLRVFLWLIVTIIALLLTLILPWFWWGVSFLACVFIALFTLMSLINSSFLAVMQAHMKMEYHFVSFVWWKLLHLFLIALFSLWVFSGDFVIDIRFISLFAAGLISVLFTTFLNYLYVSRFVKVRFLWDYEYIKTLFLISLPYWFALFLSVVYFRIDILLLWFIEWTPEGDISIALYSLPMKIVEVLMVLWVFYLNSLLPRLTDLYKESNVGWLQNIFELSFKILFSFSLALYVLSQVFSRDIITLLAHNEYIEPTFHRFSSLDVFWVVFGLLLFHFIALLYSYLLIASERQSLLLRVHLFVSILNIIWNIILIPYTSFYGAAVMTLVSQVCLCVILFFCMQKEFFLSKRLLVQCARSLILWLFLYFIFITIIAYFPLWAYTRIFFYGTIFTLIYVFWEFFISKRYIQSRL